MEPLPFFNPDHLELRQRVRSWADVNLISAGGVESDVEAGARRLVKQLSRDGFVRHAVPSSYGGARERVQARDLCILREELSRGSSLADTMFAMQALGSYPITLAGSKAQKERYLPRVGRGDSIAAFALTEPEAGSDVASMQTQAKRRGGDYALSGIKCFISNAGIADHYVVFASTEPEKRGKGISAFVVDAGRPGFVVREKTAVIAPHPIVVIAFEDCIVGEESLLGVEGDGLKIALSTLDMLRCTVGAAALGLGQRALEEAIRYSKSRRQFGQELAKFQGTQFKLADMATELEAAKLLVYQAAWAHDCGREDAKQKSSMAKLYATEAAQRIVDQAVQLHGGKGVVVGSIVERLYREVRALRIYEGTSEIQKIVIVRDLIRN